MGSQSRTAPLVGGRVFKLRMETMGHSYPRTSLRIGALARTMARQWHAGSASEHRIRTRPITVHCGSASSDAGHTIEARSQQSTITRAEHRRFIRVGAIALPPHLSTSRGAFFASARIAEIAFRLPCGRAASPTQRLEAQRLGKQRLIGIRHVGLGLPVQQANRS
ncbi:uncharacterized protein PAN0_001c0328 [Moesziomyces antarcticus]|uniref:Uncharacterized protein n=1 Tax=Pseudozyma antarctica TaxID=84753 RepID=A0A5C3FE09_PSEA2|nr:uncharacterized protein PAN0_001c0328 [Moesziomyces antarcticus]GAK62131.1 hypothetical protein PAN0_001c0328 [Moesziomyces antarcticus]SPO42664.1 uncharacterized protein PSANT_00347 [Moesziomyces antarcticus]